MGTLYGEATLLFSVLLLFKMVSTLKGKNLLPEEQILSFQSRLYFGKHWSSREAIRKSQKLFPFAKIVEKHESVSIHLNISST